MSRSLQCPGEWHRTAVAYWLVMGLLIWAPFPYGSNREWASALFSAGIFATVLVWIAANWRQNGSGLFRLTAQGGVLIAFASPVLYLLIQSIPLPPGWLEILSPNVYRLYVATGIRYWIPLSTGVDDTLRTVLNQATYCSVLALVLATAIDDRRLRNLSVALVIVGIVQVLLGYVANIYRIDFVPAILRDGHFDRITGTFVNPNHLAANIVIAVGLVIGLLSRGPPRSNVGFRSNLRMVVSELLGPRGVLVVALGILLLGLLLTGSRGAVASLAGSGLIVLVLSCVRNWKAHRTIRSLSIASASTLALGLVYAIWRYRNEFGERLEQWRATIRMAEDYTLFGVGGGNYQWVFSEYRPESLRPLVYDHVHNDYLELLVEYGIVGTSLFAIAMLYAINLIIKGYMHCRDRRIRGFVLGSLLGILSFLIHGLVDFNFHIPGNAAYFYALMGIGVSASYYNVNEPNYITTSKSSHA